MKYVVIFFSFVLFSCGTQKQVSESTFKCPESGECKYEKHENKSLIIKKDDTGGRYYQMEDHQEKTVFVYRYEKNTDKAYLDGHYIEEIIFEINNEVLEDDFTSLKPDKILFGVFCYCKGKAGYYKVENPSVTYQKKSKKITVSVNQIIEEQIFTTVEFSF
ncbi:MAG: hypothetical protein WCY06_09015 [Flavobacteriaceae bacterium]